MKTIQGISNSNLSPSMPVALAASTISPAILNEINDGFATFGAVWIKKGKTSSTIREWATALNMFRFTNRITDSDLALYFDELGVDRYDHNGYLYFSNTKQGKTNV